MSSSQPVTSQVDTAPVDALSMSEALQRVANWAALRSSRVVCFCNVHSVVTCRRDAAFQSALSSADLRLPDGAPVAWMLRRLGKVGQSRVSGPDFMWAYFAQAARRGERVFLYGSTPSTLERLQDAIRRSFPGLVVAGAWSPPFRALSEEEDQAVTRLINESGANSVWVGLGCPTQERWMRAHRGSIHAVMLGVGAAFDFHAGVRPRAPGWMRQAGLEWLHRLASEPRRLWRRYLVTNSLFTALAARQLFVRALRRGG